METLHSSAITLARDALPVIEVVPHDKLLQVTPIGGRGFAHHRFPTMPKELPGWLEFGCIRLFATETIAAGSGYAMHEHRNGEIISLVREGKLLHENTLGPAALVPADTVAVISAGRGIRHAESADASGPCRIVQIVLATRTLDAEPRAEERVIPQQQRRGRFCVLASGRSRDVAALYIDQDAALSSCILGADKAQVYCVEPGRIAYVVPLDAAICVNGDVAHANERVLVHRACVLDISATADTEVLVLDMPA